MKTEEQFFFLYREEMIRRKRNLLDSFIIPILIAFLNYLTLSYEHVRWFDQSTTDRGERDKYLDRVWSSREGREGRERSRSERIIHFQLGQ